jgi:dihydrolipoamide dehydrogenase
VFAPRAIPAVVFTDPEIAWAGLTEQEVKALRAQRPAEIFKVRRAAIDALRAKGITLNY